MRRSAQWKEGVNWLRWAQVMRHCLQIKDTNTECWDSEYKKQGLNALICYSCVLCNKTQLWWDSFTHLSTERPVAGIGMDKDMAVATLVTTPAGRKNKGAASSLMFPSQSQVPASCTSTGVSPRAEYVRILHEEMSANRTGFVRSNTEVSPFHNAP